VVIIIIIFSTILFVQIKKVVELGGDCFDGCQINFGDNSGGNTRVEFATIAVHSPLRGRYGTVEFATSWRESGEFASAPRIRAKFQKEKHGEGGKARLILCACPLIVR
jgi:hypothetical protein